MSEEMNPTHACDAGLDLILAEALGMHNNCQSSFQKDSLFSTL